MQEKAKALPFQSSDLFSTWWSQCVLQSSVQQTKLNYKGCISAAHLWLPGVVLWEAVCACQLSCPAQSQRHRTRCSTAPGAKLEQAGDACPPLQTGTPQLGVSNRNCSRRRDSELCSSPQWGIPTVWRALEPPRAQLHHGCAARPGSGCRQVQGPRCFPSAANSSSCF